MSGGTTELKTERLILRRHIIEDAKALYLRFGSDPEMFEYSGWNPYATEEMAEETVRRFLDSYGEEHFYGWAVEHEGELIGTVGAYDYDSADGSIEIGCSIERTCWGRGFASEALEKVLAYLTEHEEIRCVRAWCAAENMGSRRIMAKAGMRCFSTEQGALEIGGREYDKMNWIFERSEKPVNRRMIIRKASSNDLPGIIRLYNEVHTREESGELTTGWLRDIYPVAKTAEDSIGRGDMFVQIDGSGEIVGTGIINQIQVDVYAEGDWKYPAEDDEIMVLHTLIISVRPGHRGSGKEFLEFYEDYAREKGCPYLRLDTNARNTAARAFYKKHGYEEIGIVPTVFNGIPGVDLVLLEKRLSYTLKRFEAETDIESYIEEYVDIDSFLECCKACPNYGHIWSCPPYEFDPMDIWRAHDRILIVGYQLTFGDDRTQEAMTKALWDVKRKLQLELYEQEEQMPGSISLSAGSCQICDDCTKPKGKSCRFPDKMRYSIESLGGNVGKTIGTLCGIDLEWIEAGKLPEHFVLVSGLLK